MKKFIIVLLFFAFAKAVTAQQDPQYSQYMYNPIVVNPAYAGNRGVASIVGLHRSQWVGLDGAPRTQTLSFHTPISDSRVGLGLSVVNDELGPSDETYFAADFSYTIPVSYNGNLSLGLKGGAHLLSVDFSRLNAREVDDALLENNIDNRLSPTVGVGAYYHTDRFYLGLSTPNLLRTEHFDEENSASTAYLAEERIHYFATAGYVFDLNDNIKFKPTTLVKAVAGAPLQVDVTANFLFNERLTLGAAYRWSAAVTGLVGFQVSDSMLIGFAYDRETTELGNTVYNDGSYELFIRFELFDRYDKLITPRFF
ncbi:PorP/SprF family type IX secretion system membrane protein [Nonlabens ponticola]|uniref:Type IX secretion system membrane protein PorP/SprF n=1 Tax=Nonlabens ponticola TaxID=2496866 RepID=A0A3S9MWS1_9FLAO|nr:type IX secretion system membrane protein PorP/SprF [Nonlabens ponticola]AZQ43661.1 type IX secretion system membrane protein PorP/SprF [Nonlabens ponticola]